MDPGHIHNVEGSGETSARVQGIKHQSFSVLEEAEAYMLDEGNSSTGERAKIGGNVGAERERVIPQKVMNCSWGSRGFGVRRWQWDAGFLGNISSHRGKFGRFGVAGGLAVKMQKSYVVGDRTRQIGGFLYVEDMEIMFLRACGKFHSFDERNARQAAVFVLLNQLVQATGMEICAFRNDNGRDVCERMWQRIEELEAKNKELKELVKSNESIFEYEVRRRHEQASVVQRIGLKLVNETILVKAQNKGQVWRGKYFVTCGL
ncbi:hypothetical protein PIB30_065570 [Stylosanthes scabra]|uniref:Uncharacterized protein n=1 Tax=Stylosanthes scabra TaxID=79078 RepID=A0ABU6SMZ9_9FABA|nr:hypothetical protein [Stylosanthes scabra]